MKEVRITRTAESDLASGYTFYELQAPGVGGYFLDSLSSDIDSLALFAGIHTRYNPMLYRTFSKRFPYAIYYSVEDDTALVIAVLDYRQDPRTITQMLQHR